MNTFIALEATRLRSREPGGNVAYLLINPPVTDPTAPYHSIPYLVGASRSAGYHNYSCLDANLEAFEYLARPEQFGALLRRARTLRASIEQLASRTRRDEISYRHTLAAEGLTASAAKEAIDVLRDGELFYHYPTYKNAVSVLERWMLMLSMEMPVGVVERGFTWRTKSEANLCSTGELADPAILEAIARPFHSYLDEPFSARLKERAWDLIGFSVNYTSQLPIALHMARIARAARPNAVIAFGGTEVGDVVKSVADRRDIWRVFDASDLLVPGEGESALVEVLDAIRDRRSWSRISGVLPRNHTEYQIRYENVAALPSPAYDVWDWNRYWSPEPVVLYSPTRGCYWNKCTFCDYGLNNDKPTSPSRERPLPKALEELAALARFSRLVYFSVDAMSPRYLKSLAEGMVEAKVGVKWAAELRLERTWPKRGIGDLLAASGCIAISFGYESGSQRILDLIDKGVRIAEVPLVLEELARNGIASQMMGFTGFPTETPDEARETYRFLLSHQGMWTIAAIGRFTLTPGAIVAKQPARFGIEILLPGPSDDIRRYLGWREVGSDVSNFPLDADQRIPEELVRQVTGSASFDRPFVGGIDGTHTLLYFDRYGSQLWPTDRRGERMRPASVRDAVLMIPFESLDELTSVEQFRRELIWRTAHGLGTSSSDFRAWLDHPGNGRVGKAKVAMLSSGSLAELPSGVNLTGDSPLSRGVGILLGAEGHPRS
jgi:anaerobic magnesium-protoporphyrin IX monomethyl ester cyclase